MSQTELNEFREELLRAVRMLLPTEPTKEDYKYAFLCEVGRRLTQAEEFQDFIPNCYMGSGSSNRKLRVYGYELDEANDSMHLPSLELSWFARGDGIS